MDAVDVLRVLFRSSWNFRGKYRLFHFLASRLSPLGKEGCVRAVRMWDGTSMRVDFRSLTERIAFWTGEYERHSIERFASWLKEDSVVLDVGANIGFYSIGLGRRLRGGGGNVYAFEPVPANYDRLLENIALNGLDDVVLPHRLALGDSEGEVTLGMEEPDGAPTGNAVVMQGKVFKRQTCFSARLSTLDRFAEEHDVRTCTFLKADVEGAEVMVLRGAGRFIARCRPVIYGEFNCLFLRQMGASFVDAANLIAPLGYRMFIETPLAGGTGSGARSGSFVPMSVMRDDVEHVLMVPEETPRDSLLKLGVVPDAVA